MDWKLVAESLVATGPLALVLGYAVRVLWADNQALRSEVRALNDRVLRIMGGIAGMDVSSEGE